MDKHTQINCQLLPANCLSVFDYYLVLALKGFMYDFVRLCFRYSSDMWLRKFSADFRQ